MEYKYIVSIDIPDGHSLDYGNIKVNTAMIAAWISELIVTSDSMIGHSVEVIK